MKSLLKAVYHSLPSFVQNPIRRFAGGSNKPKPTESLMYRVELFNELNEIVDEEYFKDCRMLEIGPKDGLDSMRLARLFPKELVLMDLPEKRDGVEKWLGEISCPHKYIEANIMYLPADEFSSLGKYKLIWCTGVLYHNAEQLRMLSKLYQLLDVGGYLVLESATLRFEKTLRDGCFVEIHYPETYRHTGTVTHLPSAKAIKAWLAMVGFQEIHDSSCFEAFNKDLIGQRYACICKKNADDESDSYYQKSGLNPEYKYGNST